MTRCRPGDLAVYVGRDVDFLGRTMTVVREDPEAFRHTGCVAWVVDPPMPSKRWPGMFADGVFDSALRPLRDNDGQDETLTWAPLEAVQ